MTHRRQFDTSGDLTLLRPAEAAAAVGVPASTVRRWIHENRLAVHREGRAVWVSEDEVIELEHSLRIPGVEGRRRAAARGAA